MEEILARRKFLMATVDRIETDKAVLVFDSGQLLDWPVNQLPEGVSEGARIKLVIYSDKAEQIEREEMAKKVLNEILKTD